MQSAQPISHDLRKSVSRHALFEHTVLTRMPRKRCTRNLAAPYCAPANLTLQALTEEALHDIDAAEAALEDRADRRKRRHSVSKFANVVTLQDGRVCKVVATCSSLVLHA